MHCDKTIKAREMLKCSSHVDLNTNYESFCHDTLSTLFLQTENAYSIFRDNEVLGDVPSFESFLSISEWVAACNLMPFVTLTSPFS